MLSNSIVRLWSRSAAGKSMPVGIRLRGKPLFGEKSLASPQIIPRLLHNQWQVDILAQVKVERLAQDVEIGLAPLILQPQHP